MIESFGKWFIKPLYPEGEKPSILKKIRDESSFISASRIRNNPSIHGYSWLAKGYEKSVEGVVKFSLDNMKKERSEKEIKNWKKLQIVNSKNLSYKDSSDIKITISDDDRQNYRKTKIFTQRCRKIHSVFKVTIEIGVRLAIIWAMGLSAYLTFINLKGGKA